MLGKRRINESDSGTVRPIVVENSPLAQIGSAADLMISDLPDDRLDDDIRKEATALEAELELCAGYADDLKNSQMNAVTRAHYLGGLLLERQSRVGHGGWAPYLETVGLNARSASDYMRLAAHFDSDDALESSIRASLRVASARTPGKSTRSTATPIELAAAKAALASLPPRAETEANTDQLDDLKSENRMLRDQLQADKAGRRRPGPSGSAN